MLDSRADRESPLLHVNKLYHFPLRADDGVLKEYLTSTVPMSVVKCPIFFFESNICT